MLEQALEAFTILVRIRQSLRRLAPKDCRKINSVDTVNIIRLNILIHIFYI